MTTERPRPRRGLAARLMLAQGIVVAAGILTAAAIAAVVGPPLFHQHLLQSGHPADPTALSHIDQAYTGAGAIALGAGLVTALLAAFVVTWYVSRRLTSPLAELADVATRLSRGDYAARAPRQSSGPELDRLAATFNDLAARLETTEDTRRRLLADLAHEMRTPLATIGAHLDGLDDGVINWNADVGRVLHDQTARLVRLAEDVTEVSRAEEGRLDLHREPARIGDLIAAAVDGIRADFEAKDVHLFTGGSAGDGAKQPTPGERNASVIVDRQRIVQLLTNLLTNALRHTPSGGTVDVTVAVRPREIQVDVVDTGEGIPAEQLGHIFERFYRGDTARDVDHGGSGIGLTIAQGIALAHGGTLHAISDGRGAGSTFRLTLQNQH